MKDYSKIRIAIDGPGGAGKSSVAKLIAKRLDIIYVDTGALYRSIGLYVSERGIDPDDTEKIKDCLSGIEINMVHENGEQKIYLCGKDVGERIRTPMASKYASAVSKIPEVRAFLLDIQRQIASKGGVIMDGRDIGTVIIPDAELKVFLTATPEARAMRRYKELCEKGMEQSYESVLADIKERDKNDSEREIAPLVPADDAVVFVNDGYNLEESADYIIDLVRKL